MFDFFAKILGYFETGFEFFFNFCESLFLALEVLTKSIVFPGILAGLLPAFLGSALAIVVALAVIKFILGK